MVVTIVSFIVLLGILIFVHEFGHFLAAKLVGVKVEKFSLGFRPKLFSFKKGETEYQLGMIPLGGYVALLGEQPDEELSEEDKPRSLTHKPYWAKSLIILAGPLFNVFFAVVALFAFHWYLGIDHTSPILGPMDSDSPMAQAGLQMDDVVLALDGNEIKYYNDILETLGKNTGDAVSFTVSRNGVPLTLSVSPQQKAVKDLLGKTVQIWFFGLRPRTIPVIGEVPQGKPAEKAGLLPGDLIVSLDGEPVKDWNDVAPVITGTEEKPSKFLNPDGTAAPIRLSIMRDGVPMDFTIQPELEPLMNLKGDTIYSPRIGISSKVDIVYHERIGPIRAFDMATAECWNIAMLTVRSVWGMIATDEISPKVMGGPISIAKISGDAAHTGLDMFLWLMALISINLAILNLIPLPILDGGQFLLFTIEAIKGSPISLKTRSITQMAALCALGLLMIFVFYNDIARLVQKPPTPTQIERTE
ncbi:MAG: RIP metalloprotease RseP [Deltaproteobacteria bacterium]|jgi:regulator of sigma E protease|nr:RIP metalloprotease RseP [Deltaproteobacteria bacterium]